MRAETELFKDKIEVSLDGRQIFYLFFGGAVIAALVFVLGVMVGRRVEARAHTDSRPATSAVMDPLAALDQLSQRDDLAFPSTLATGEAVSKTAGEASGSSAAGEATQEASASGAAPAVSAVKTEGKQEAKPEASQGAEAGSDTTGAAKPELAAQAKPVEAAKPVVAQQAPARFTLQLSSFRERAEADAFFTKLKQAGYQPYVVEAEVPGKGTWYRVRLGHYDSYDAAIEAKKEFEASQKIIAYVTRLKRGSDG